MRPVLGRMDELLRLLEENLRSYTALLELAEEMHAKLHGGKVDSVGGIMSTRAVLQDDISKRDGLINSIRNDLPGILPDRRITVLVDRGISLAAAIQEVDQRSRKLMEDEQARLHKHLAELRQGKKALHRYKRRTKENPKFFDRCG